MQSGSFLRKWKGKEKKAEPEPPPVESEDVLLEENPKEYVHYEGKGRSNIKCRYFVCKSGECSTKMNAACPKFVAKCNHMYVLSLPPSLSFLMICFFLQV